MKKKKVMKMETVIRKYGYEYHLVEAIRPDDAPQPAVFGMKNYALKSVRKCL
jgi:hypothetical protein